MKKESEHIIVNWNLSEASSNVILRAIRASLFESPPMKFPPEEEEKSKIRWKKTHERANQVLSVYVLIRRKKKIIEQVE